MTADLGALETKDTPVGFLLMPNIMFFLLLLVIEGSLGTALKKLELWDLIEPLERNDFEELELLSSELVLDEM